MLRRFTRTSAAWLIAFTAPLMTWPLLAQPARALSIVHVNVVDVVEGRILPNRTVTVSGDAIASITQATTPPGNVRVVDGRGKFLMPGLWDMHSHAGRPSLPLYVANGVISIRDMGNDLDSILAIRDAVAAGVLLGPRVFAAGPILDDAPGDWPLRLRVKTPDDGRAAVRMLKNRGVDLIKVHDHTPKDAFFAIAEETRRQHLPLAGHVPLGLKPEEVIQAGQGDIEHLSNMKLWWPCSGGAGYRPDACREFFTMLARRGIWQTPTIFAWSEMVSIGTRASAVRDSELAFISKTVREGWANQNLSVAMIEEIGQLRLAAKVGAVVTKDMANAGVGILAGCDMMIAGFCVHDELAAMVHGGMKPVDALRTATRNPAKYFALQDSVGAVEAGQRADLVLLDANPLSDITNSRRIHAVVIAGRFLDRSELDLLLDRARAAANQ